MKIAKIKSNMLAAWMTLVLAVAVVAGFPAITAHAASGSVYTCTINRCYAHPVTGVIEDSGGESSYATGQGMVEGCVYNTGILELTDAGEYYLTIRLSLMNYTSGHSFQAQKVGDSGWSSISEIGITGKGTDSNGSTADVCMRVPSENCVIRGSMYVEPMGRDVVFYLYPSDYSAGNNTNMNATIVTESSQASTSSSDTAQQSQTQSSQTTQSTTASSSLSSGNASLSSETKTDTDNTAASEETTDNSSQQLQSSITQAAQPSGSSVGTDSSTLDSADGLNLSTAKKSAASESGSGSSGSHIFQIALAVIVCGLILIGAVAGVVYYFRRNWKRWGGAEDDDSYGDYEDDDEEYEDDGDEEDDER